MDRSLVAYPGSFLARSYEGKSPFPGFQSTERVLIGVKQPINCGNARLQTDFQLSRNTWLDHLEICLLMDETDLLLAQLESRAVPKGTKGSEVWATNNYNDWAKVAQQPALEDLFLRASIKRWYVETRGVNNQELDVDTQRKLFHSLARVIKKKVGWSLKNDEEFTSLRDICNVYVKTQRVKQQKTEPKKAAYLTDDEEETVYNSEVLLPTHLLALNWALFFQLSIGWGCRGGVLAFADPRFIKIVTKGEHRFLQYNTVTDKNHQGKVSDNHIPPDLFIMENRNDSARCPLALFEKMLSVRPNSAPEDRLFLRPLVRGRTTTCWYAASAVG